MPDDRSAPGIGTLLKDLAEGSGELLRHEARLARLEAVGMARGAGVGTAMVAVGGVVGLLGALCLLAGLIMLIGDQWLRDNYWLASLIVTLIAGGIAGFYAWRGMQRLSPARLAPNQTVATLKEDVEWLKRQRT
jgi:Putative Actinobacterial Holin-X, holin superfamily III